MPYLLPCPRCGEKTPIETRHAGEQRTCVCGATLDVPTLREIRNLETAEPVATVGRSRPNWNASLGCLFAGGILVALIGAGAVAMGTMGIKGLPKPPPVPFDAEGAAAEVRLWTPKESYEVWSTMRKGGLGAYVTPAHVQAREMVGRLQMVSNIGYAVIGLGFLMSAVTFFFRGRRQR